MSTSTRSKKVTVQVTLADFDSEAPFRVVRDGVSIKEFTPLTSKDYSPRGGTPLRDATAKFIAHLSEQAGDGRVTIGLLLDRSGSMSGNEAAVISGVNEFVGSVGAVSKVDPETSGKVMAVILTDGLENSSNEVSSDALSAAIAAREAEGWTFIYLGANQDAWDVGHATGFSGTGSGQTFNYAATPAGTSSGLRMASASTASYLSSNKVYAAQAAMTPSGTIMEDGTVVSTNIDPLASQGTAYDPSEAINKITGSLGGSA